MKNTLNKIPQNQKDLLNEIKSLAGNPMWDELALQMNIPKRTLKTYRMPDTSNDYRWINRVVMKDILTFRNNLLTSNKIPTDKISSEAAKLSNNIKFLQIQKEQGDEEARKFQNFAIQRPDGHFETKRAVRLTPEQLEFESKKKKGLRNKLKQAKKKPL
jgi:hypothetical protein